MEAEKEDDDGDGRHELATPADGTPGPSDGRKQTDTKI